MWRVGTESRARVHTWTYSRLVSVTSRFMLRISTTTAICEQEAKEEHTRVKLCVG